MRRVPACAAALLAIAASPAQQNLAVFHAPTIALGVDSPPFQRLLDVDGDGDLDAIGSRIRSDGQAVDIAAWRNDAGVFTQAYRTTFPATGLGGATNLRCAVGDFDGDTLQDACFAGARFVLQLKGELTFQLVPSLTTLPAGDWVNGVAAARLDGDQLDDLAFLRDGSFRGLEVQLSSGPTVAIAMPLFALGGPHVMQADADPQPELGVTISGHQMMPFELAGNVLTPLPMLVTTPAASNIHLWTSGDIDGDGDGDTVVFKPGYNNQPATYQRFRHDGTTLVAEPEAIGGPAEYLADIDGDGVADGVCCGGGGGPGTPTWPQLDFASTFEIARNDGTGTFAPAWAFPGIGSRSMAGAADVDADGDTDFVAGRCVFYGHGPWLTHPLPATRANLNIVRRHSLRDADRDGDLDLGIGPWGGVRGLGDGSFEALNLPGVTPPPGRTFGGGIVVDHDGDGADDWVMQQYAGSPPGFEFMALLRNNGGGHFTYGGPVASMRIGFGVTVDHFLTADLDGDGALDLVANSRPDFDGYRSEIYWRRGASYVAGPVYATQRIDAVADFDLDGVPDVVRSDASSYYVARGTGNPAAPFGTPQGLASHFGLFRPMAVLVRDLNEDGRPDLVLPTVSATVFFSVPGPAGTIVFVSHTHPAGTANWVDADDFDGDGRCDLAFADLQGEPNVTLLLLRFTGNPVPGPADYVQVRQVMGAGVIGDMDGDGDPDHIGQRAVHNVRFFGAGAGQRLQYGAGVAGEAGAVPVLGARGILRPGNVVQLALTGVPGPTIAALDLSFAPASLPNVPLPGLTLLIDPTNLLTITVPISMPGDGRGAASLALPIGLDPGFAGAVFYLQAFVLDTAAPTVITQTNGLRLQVGA
jgi:hypothetical protein